MAFEKLNFSKNWESASDFPAVETSEVQVRKDMQILHDEAKDALNAVVDKLNAKKLDEYPSGGVAKSLGDDDTTLPTSKAVRDAIVQSGALPSGGSTGQVLRKKSAKNYDYDWTTVQALITASGLLKGAGDGDIQAAVAGTDYVAPTDKAFQSLKKHSWRRRTSQMVTGSAVTIGDGDRYDIPLNSRNYGGLVIAGIGVGSSGGCSATYASAVVAEHLAGRVLYDESTKVTSDQYSTVANLSTFAASMLGKYMLRGGQMWKIPSDAVFRTGRMETSGGDQSIAYFSKLAPVTLQVGDWEYITADSASAFPKNGYSGGYVYEYLGNYQSEGILFPARISTGYYWGTGRRDTVTCKVGFRPKLFLLYRDTRSQDFLSENLLLYVAGSPWMKRFYGGTSYSLDSSGIAATVTDTGISFPSGSFEDVGERYRWAAIG